MEAIVLTHSETQPPLTGLRVIETEGLLTAYCGKLLASLGAEVIKLEAPDGDPARHMMSAAEGTAFTSGSTYWYNNLGKQIFSCGLATAGGRATFDALVNHADILLTDMQPGTMETLGLPLDDLTTANPRLIVTAITPFGLTGPYRDLAATDTIMLASGGQLFLTGYPDRRPLRYGGLQGYKQGSIHGAYGTLIAVFERLTSGRGQVVDVSVQECVANSLQTTMQMYDLTGQVRKRVGSRLAECADGYVRNLGIARGSQALVDWLDDEKMSGDLASLISQISPSERLGDSLTNRIEAALAPLFASKTKREIFGQALQRRIALTPVNTAAEVLEMPELEERGFWAEVSDTEAGTSIRVPSGPFRIAPAGLVVPIESVSIKQVPPPVSPPAVAPDVSASKPGPPLAGVVVADFTWFGAGPMATRVLAHFGATVVKIESSQRIDGIRLAPPFRGEPGVNKSGFFNNFNSGKQSITLDMHSEGGVSVAERLITVADIVSDNFSPGVLAGFGLTDERIHELNPRAVILHMPMGGTFGELRKAVGFGATIEAVSGLVHLMGDPDRTPVGTEVNYPDYGSNPYHAATALIAGLLAVRDSGAGQVIELAQVESTISFIGEALVEAQRTGTSPSRQGNVAADSLFNEVLRCRGDDQWCAVSCRDEAELHVLLELAGLGASVLVELQPLGLAENHRALGELLNPWSSRQDKYELMDLLQEHGIPAYPAIDSSDLLTRDPQLAARKHHVVLNHPDAGLVTFDRPSVRLSRTDGSVPSPAPCLGQHTEFVLTGLLGLGESEVSALADSGALV